MEHYGLPAAGKPRFMRHVLLWLLAFALLHVQSPEWLQNLTRAVVVAVLFLGPVPVSAVGILLGGLLGVYIVYRMRKRLAIRASELPPAGLTGNRSP